MKRVIFSISMIAAGVISSLAAHAETTDFGGYSERFKGGGDKIPPRWQIDVPSASTEPFFVKWNCTDDNADSQEIRTELWLYRAGAPTGELVANFLGFPASVLVNEGLLGVTTFRQGLPISLKLLARDRAGITTISPSITVRAQDNSLTTCDLNISTEGTESTGGTTGTPSSSVNVDDAKVNVTQPSETQLGVASAGSLLGDPCDIDSVCFDNSRLTFSSSLALNAEGDATGTVTIVPGNLVVNVTGSSSVDGVNLQSLAVSGDTTIDGADATVTLNCNR